MSHRLDNLTGTATEGIGLRFLNEEWNDSISNDHPFIIQWNESLNEAQAPELGLFKITYPKDGVVEYELVSNLTDVMNNGNATCSWTPHDLDDNLYTLWLSSSRDARSNWTTSPPWRLKEPPRKSLHWAAPIVIPILVLLAVYTLGLTTCIVYRRRRNARREKEKSKGKYVDKDEASETPILYDRQPSVDTVFSIQSLDSPDEVKKPKLWLLTQSASGSLVLSPPSRKDSDATLVSSASQGSEQILISPINTKAVIASRMGRTVGVVMPSNGVEE